METIQDEENTSLICGKSSGNDGEIETSIIEEIENPLLAFIKIPLEDRKKYEKLNSNDFITSDDSDSDFNSKRSRLINNIQDKPQIKNKIQNDEESDCDSIGSASDLRANELVELDDFNPNTTLKKLKKYKIIDDGISESIKTCTSSSYHAECESVATNEDNKSRTTRKIKVKKRSDRMNDSTSTLTNENVLPSTDQYGDKPLLLDDELDYDDSGENTDNKTREEETDDVFSLAPFKTPYLHKKNKSVQKRNIVPPPPKININLENFDIANRMTSTPILCKNNNFTESIFNSTVHSTSNYGIVTVNESSVSKELFCSSNIFEDDLNSLTIIKVENNNNNQIEQFEEKADKDDKFIKFGANPYAATDLIQKNKKEKIKFSKLDDLTSVLPVKFSQRVKANISYKKVVPETSSTKNKNCFSNMSFEDYPSDAEIDSTKLITNKKTKKTVPFEVIRNEKMLLEAEKKINSLKRKSKP